MMFKVKVGLYREFLVIADSEEEAGEIVHTTDLETLHLIDEGFEILDLVPDEKIELYDRKEFNKLCKIILSPAAEIGEVPKVAK